MTSRTDVIPATAPTATSNSAQGNPAWRNASETGASRRRALPHPQPPPLRVAGRLPRRVGADRRRRAPQGRALACAARPGGEWLDVSLQLPRGAASGSSRSGSSCDRRPSGRRPGTKSHGSNWPSRAAPRRSRQPGGVSSPAATACSRPTACARSSTSPRASCASFARRAERDRRGPRLQLWRAPTDNDGLPQVPSRRSGVLPQWLELGLDRLEPELVPRAQTAPRRDRPRAAGLDTHAALPARRGRRAARGQRVGSRPASRDVPRVGVASPSTRPRAARLVRRRAMGGVLRTGSPRRSSAASRARSPTSTCRTSSRRSTATPETRRLTLTDDAGFGLEVQGRPTIGFAASHFTAADLTQPGTRTSSSPGPK